MPEMSAPSLVENFTEMKKNNETFIQKIYRHIAVTVSVIIGLCTVLFCIRRRTDNNRKLDKSNGVDNNRIRQSVENGKRAADEARATIEKIKGNKQNPHNS